MALTTEHTMRILLLSDLISHLSKVDPVSLATRSPREVVDGFFADREDAANREVEEGDNSLKGLKVSE